MSFLYILEIESLSDVSLVSMFSINRLPFHFVDGFFCCAPIQFLSGLYPCFILEDMLCVCVCVCAPYFKVLSNFSDMFFSLLSLYKIII